MISEYDLTNNSLWMEWYFNRRKWANALFKKTIQHFAQFPKLIREMPIFETRFSQNRVIKKKN